MSTPDILAAGLGSCKRLLRVRTVVFRLWKSKRSLCQAQALSETFWKWRDLGGAKRETEEKVQGERPRLRSRGPRQVRGVTCRPSGRRCPIRFGRYSV